MCLGGKQSKQLRTSESSRAPLQEIDRGLKRDASVHPSEFWGERGLITTREAQT